MLVNIMIDRVIFLTQYLISCEISIYNLTIQARIVK